MNLEEIGKRLRWFLDAGITVEITGPSGIGKSEMIVQKIEEYSKQDGFDWGLGRHFTATYTPPDITGYLALMEQEVTGPDGKTRKEPVSKFSMPPWMLDDHGLPLNNYKRGICVLEEHDKATPDVKKAAAPILLSGGIATWQFHEGIGVIVLSNDASSSRQGSTKNFDFVINRICIIKAAATMGGWMKWADEHNVDPAYKAFAEKFPNIVFSGEVPEVQGPFCTPRSLTNLSLAAKPAFSPEGRLIDKEGYIEIATGMIGAPAAMEIVTWMTMKDDVPTWAEIVKDPKKCKVPDNVGGQLMAAHQCAHAVDEKTIDQAVTYIKRLQPEFHLTFAKSATQRNFRLVNSKPFEKWVADAPQLVALINALGGQR